MKLSAKTKYVNKIVNSQVKEELRRNKETLLQIQNALDVYLGDKRSTIPNADVFPRFFFLSDDELIDFLSKANDLQHLNQNISKCFHHIHQLELVIDYKGVSADGLVSVDNERVQLLKPLSSKSEIEVLRLLNMYQRSS